MKRFYITHLIKIENVKYFITLFLCSLKKKLDLIFMNNNSYFQDMPMDNTKLAYI